MLLTLSPTAFLYLPCMSFGAPSSKLCKTIWFGLKLIEKQLTHLLHFRKDGFPLRNICTCILQTSTLWFPHHHRINILRRRCVAQSQWQALQVVRVFPFDFGPLPNVNVSLLLLKMLKEHKVAIPRQITTPIYQETLPPPTWRKAWARGYRINSNFQEHLDVPITHPCIMSNLWSCWLNQLLYCMAIFRCSETLAMKSLTIFQRLSSDQWSILDVAAPSSSRLASKDICRWKTHPVQWHSNDLPHCSNPQSIVVCLVFLNILLQFTLYTGKKLHILRGNFYLSQIACFKM